MKYIFILMMTMIILFIGVVNLLNLYILIVEAGSHNSILIIQGILLVIGSVFMYHLSRGLIHFIKVNGIGRKNGACSIKSKVRHNLVICLLLIEVMTFLFAGCGFMLINAYANKINGLVWIYISLLIPIPVMIWWLYSLPLLEIKKHSGPN